MTGRRKGTGQAVRPVESKLRSRRMHTARVATAGTPSRRARAALELVLAIVRRMPAGQADQAATLIVTTLGQLARDLDRMTEKKGAVSR